MNKNNNIMDNEIVIKHDFINIPKTTEKRTSPFLYSFFNGLKKVCSKRGTEKSFKR